MHSDIALIETCKKNFKERHVAPRGGRVSSNIRFGLHLSFGAFCCS